MIASVSGCGLEIKGINDLSEYENMEWGWRKSSMKYVMFSVIGLCLFDIIYSSIIFYFYMDVYATLIYVLCVNLLSIGFFIFFYIILPYKNISFDGMGSIPILVFLVIFTEFNIAYYEINDIQSLYLLLLS